MRVRGTWAPAFCAALALAVAPAPASAVPTGDVDPMIGSAGEGDAFPGAAVPFGLATPGPDSCTAATGFSTAGWCAGSPVQGFSQTHVSGTGGAPRYGTFRLMAAPGRTGLLPTPSPATAVTASPGLFAATLATGVRATMTTSRLVGVTRFAFPAGATRGTVALDATSVLRHGSAFGQRIRSATIRRRSATTVSGSVTTTGGWGRGGLTVHFAARFRGADRLTLHRRSGAARGDVLRQRGDAGRIGVVASASGRGGRTVTVHVALSMRDEAAARRTLDGPAGRASFDATLRSARAAWRRVLAPVAVRGGTPEQRRAFATALYRAHQMPTDLTGQGPRWAGSAPYYDNFFTLWDTFRTQKPLLTLLAPERMRGIVRTLLAVQRRDGWLPDARIGSVNGLVQGGSSADVVLADVLGKRLGGVDRAAARRAVLASADRDATRPTDLGRELRDYRRLGYLPAPRRTSASRTLEYAYADFAASRVLAAAGDDRNAARLLRRSRSWQALWDPSVRAIRPRTADGAWVSPFDPGQVFHDWPVPFYEGSSRQYSTFVPHDVQGLIDRTGGDAGFVPWLDDVMAGHHDPSNEPSLLTPWLYVHAGRPDRTSVEVRRILAERYRPTADGLPGNDDAGTLSSWFAFAAMGLYPNAGQPYYYLSAPLFTRVDLPLPTGRTCRIEAPAAAPGPQVITGAALDGRPLDRAWLTHDELLGCRTLRLDVGTTPNGWGTTGRRPPSTSASAG